MLNRLIAKLVSNMPEKLVWIFSKRYIAGKSLNDAILLTRKLNALNAEVTVDVLGEHIQHKEEVIQYKQKYFETIESIKTNGLRASISLKPSMFGLLLDPDFCYQQIKEVVEKVKLAGLLVCIDMEDSLCTELEINLFKTLYKDYPTTVTIVLQAYLKRTLKDIQNLKKFNSDTNPINIRLCKGIYVESPEIAFQSKKEISKNYLACLEFMLDNNFFCAIATHDEKLIAESLQLIKIKKTKISSYEFQMLYGVRPELRKKIVHAGHPMRVYVPFGTYWFAYSTRRLKENPRLVWHIIKALLFRG